MSRTDYYATLGLPENATQDDIKKSFRKLAKSYHPDRNPGDASAEKRFKEINEAYEVLGDAEKRRKHDQLRRFGMGGGTGNGIDLEDLFGGGEGGGLGGLGDLFSRMFGGRGGGAYREARARPQRGEDIDLRIQIPFETSVVGGRVTVRVPREDPCDRCSGVGNEPGSTVETCPVCRGTGKALQGQMGFAISEPCPRCFGKGKLVRSPCRQCRGQGRVQADRTLEVKIPRGIADGRRIRLKGEGEMGIAGGPRGDAFVRVIVAVHDEFERRGLDVFSEVTVNVAQAILGTERDVRTVGGSVSLRIPAGVQPGTKLRLEGRGIEDGSGRHGNHVVTVRVELPKELSVAARKLMKDFAHESDLPL